MACVRLSIQLGIHNTVNSGENGKPGLVIFKKAMLGGGGRRLLSARYLGTTVAEGLHKTLVHEMRFG